MAAAVSPGEALARDIEREQYDLPALEVEAQSVRNVPIAPDPPRYRPIPTEQHESGDGQ